MMPRATIFDLRRFPTHDGAGIRTTVFFKGCPLACVWCHNPEGISIKRRPLFYEDKCIKCGSCVKNAVNRGMSFNRDKEIVLDYNAAEDWDSLMDICPTGAIEWDSRQVGLDELVEEIMLDKPFFRNGGGVTLSGGEPLLQAEIAAELLKRLKEGEHIHTAIETALLVSRKRLSMVLPYLDYIFTDCKLYDNESHISATGVSNKLILENIKFLLTSEYRDKVVVRTPMIREYTASDENIAAIAGFISGIYPSVRYELLNCDPAVLAKYDMIGRECSFSVNPERFSEKEMNHFAKIACSNGIKNIYVDI